MTVDPEDVPVTVVDHSDPGGVDGERATGLGTCAVGSLLAVPDGAQLWRYHGPGARRDAQENLRNQ
jgi:hypothetical protein